MISRITVIEHGYKKIIKLILFLFNSEFIHNLFLKIGSFTGNSKTLKTVLSYFFGKNYTNINKNIAGIEFKSPIGLAAGFDYDADLFKISSSLGFGFTTIGTVTNTPYEGNKKPQLGRLVQTKGLLVNKGFKSSGIDEVLKKINQTEFEIPTGISIGKTNIIELDTIEKASEDIKTAFQKVLDSGINFSFYELNISCPNLHGNLSFYTKENLTFLLKEIESLPIKKPVFIKMPIELENQQTIDLLNIIKDFNIKGVIFGNLQKNRNHPTIIQKEINKYEKGYSSGLPTKERSTELIRITKDMFGERFIIVGCGGIFNTKDAQDKLDAGADLLQLITGLVFEGPQLPAKINYDLSSTKS
jgi:dihydroorotate dehydrogenase